MRDWLRDDVADKPAHTLKSIVHFHFSLLRLLLPDFVAPPFDFAQGSGMFVGSP